MIVEPLTDFIWLGNGYYGDDRRTTQIASLFSSLAISLVELKQFYRDLSPQPPLTTCSLSRLFPYQTFFKGADGKDVSFSYVAPLDMHDSAQLVFQARKSTEPQLLVVKFVRRYGGRAHDILAKIGLAPKLLYCGTDDDDATDFGGLRMVVMEWIDAYTASVLRLSSGAREDVRKAIDELHKHNFAFSDLRGQNIMLTGNGAKLIDFDWSAEDGIGRYPTNLNDKLDWHPDVKCNSIMKKEHDTSLLRFL